MLRGAPQYGLLSKAAATDASRLVGICRARSMLGASIFGICASDFSCIGGGRTQDHPSLERTIQRYGPIPCSTRCMLHLAVQQRGRKMIHVFPELLLPPIARRVDSVHEIELMEHNPRCMGSKCG